MNFLLWQFLMSNVYNFLTWRNNDGVLYAYPACSQWIYTISFNKESKLFELSLINGKNHNDKTISMYTTIGEALKVAQKHFNDNYGEVSKSSYLNNHGMV